MPKNKTVVKQSMTLLPPRAGICQACAVDHKPGEPHNQQSLYWQYWFYGRNGRWPEWPDALAHCTDELYGFWRKELATFGVEIPPRAETPVQRETQTAEELPCQDGGEKP